MNVRSRVGKSRLAGHRACRAIGRASCSVSTLTRVPARNSGAHRKVGRSVIPAQLFADAENPRRRIEAFMLDSWLDHLRQHERVTEADRLLQQQVHAYHRGGAAPKITHLVAAH